MAELRSTTRQRAARAGRPVPPALRLQSRRLVASCFGGLILLIAAGCGLNPQKNYQRLRPMLVQRDYNAANNYLNSVKTSFYSKKNRLLFYMDKAMTLFLAKRYKESNVFLEKAKLAAEELWTESVGEHAASWLTTDNSLSYQGEDFEKVMLHFIGALNYIGLGDYESARVEARQVTQKLEYYNQRYGEDAKNVYNDDAFARWLAGKLSETAGGYSALNSAWIDYQKAISVYKNQYAERYGTQLPTIVIQDALRVLEALGDDFRSDYEALRAKHPDVSYTPAQEAQKQGELILFHLNGEAPYKVDRFWTVSTSKGVIRIAYPQFVAKPHGITTARMRAAEHQASASTRLVQDITAIAMRNLQDHIGRIKAKAIARAVAKYVASRSLYEGGRAVRNNSDKQGGKGLGAAMQLAGLLTNVGSALAEEADKRSWITLPAQIRVARLFLPPGPTRVLVEFVRADGSVARTQSFNVDLEAGQTEFITTRTYE